MALIVWMYCYHYCSRPFLNWTIGFYGSPIFEVFMLGLLCKVKFSRVILVGLLCKFFQRTVKPPPLTCERGTWRNEWVSGVGALIVTSFADSEEHNQDYVINSMPISFSTTSSRRKVVLLFRDLALKKQHLNTFFEVRRFRCHFLKVAGNFEFRGCHK